MTIDIRSLGYVRVESTDLEQWRHFAGKVLGLVEGPLALVECSTT